MKGTQLAVGGGVLVLMLAIGVATHTLMNPPEQGVPIQVQDSVDQRRSEKEASQFERGPALSHVIEAHELDVWLQSKAGAPVAGPDQALLAKATATRKEAEKALEAFQALQQQQLAAFGRTTQE